MSGYLLDTSITSLLDPSRGLLTPELEAWLTVRQPRLHISVVTVLETAQGIEKLRTEGQGTRADALESWLDRSVRAFGDRVLPLHTGLAAEAGKLSARAFSVGRHPGLADIVIAATAASYGLLLLTRNLRHFEPLGIDVADPTQRLPR